MGRGLSDLQKQIVLVMWRKRAAFEWVPTWEEWIGPGTEDDWLDDKDTFNNPDHWICEPPSGMRHLSLAAVFIPRGGSKAERKRRLTSIRRAVKRLEERGLITFSCRDLSYVNLSLDLALTPWGSLYGWLISEGRPMSHIPQKHPQPADDYEGPRSLCELEDEVAEIVSLNSGQPLATRRTAGTGQPGRELSTKTSFDLHVERLRAAEKAMCNSFVEVAQHEQIIERLRRLERWQQRRVLDALTLMVETPPIAANSTDS